MKFITLKIIIIIFLFMKITRNYSKKIQNKLTKQKNIEFLQVKNSEKLKNPDESSSGGANPLYSRYQPTAEHLFMAWPHYLEDVEHFNPYAFNNFQKERRNKQAEYYQEKKNHNDFQKELDERMNHFTSGMKNLGLNPLNSLY